eukprot:3702049-Rhodomonas_salina.1
MAAPARLRGAGREEWERGVWRGLPDASRRCSTRNLPPPPPHTHTPLFHVTPFHQHPRSLPRSGAIRGRV